MATDPVTTSLVGLGVGALGVLVMAALNWPVFTQPRAPEGRDEKQALLISLFFTLLMGFLFVWVLGYASANLPVGGAFDGALFGGLVWLAFVLPTDLTQMAWEEASVPRHMKNLGAWLLQFILGGAFAGALLLA